MKIFGTLLLLTLLSTSVRAAEVAAAAPGDTTQASQPKQPEKPAADAASTTNAPPKFKLSTSVDYVPVVGQIARGVIVAATNQFSFVVPKGYRIRADEGTKKVVLVSSESGMVVSAQVHEYAGELKTDALREQAIAKYPSGKMVDQFTAAMQDKMGNAYSFQWRSPAGTMVGSIAAYVPFGNGHLEFEVTGPGDKMETSVYTLLNFLMSFRSAPVGAKLEVQAFLTEQ